jgi:hypothetical protein
MLCHHAPIIRGTRAGCLLDPLRYAVSVMSILQREAWMEPVHLGEGFRLHKERCGRQLEAICHVQTHQLGWELVPTVNESLQRSEVCRTQDAVLDLTERWKAAMTGKGWR